MAGTWPGWGAYAAAGTGPGGGSETQFDKIQALIEKGGLSMSGPVVSPWLFAGEMVDALVDQGDVDEANSSDLDCVGKAIAAAARRGLNLT